MQLRGPCPRNPLNFPWQPEQISGFRHPLNLRLWPHPALSVTQQGTDLVQVLDVCDPAVGSGRWCVGVSVERGVRCLQRMVWGLRAILQPQLQARETEQTEPLELEASKPSLLCARSLWVAPGPRRPGRWRAGGRAMPGAGVSVLGPPWSGPGAVGWLDRAPRPGPCSWVIGCCRPVSALPCAHRRWGSQGWLAPVGTKDLPECSPEPSPTYPSEATQSPSGLSPLP